MHHPSGQVFASAKSFTIWSELFTQIESLRSGKKGFHYLVIIIPYKLNTNIKNTIINIIKKEFIPSGEYYRHVFIVLLIRKDNNIIQGETERECDDDPDDWVQCGDSTTSQRRHLHCVGRRWSGENPQTLATLLPERRGSHLRGGQRRPRETGRG